MLCRMPDKKKHFVEVKSSTGFKKYCDVSVAELQQAAKYRQLYTIYRVCGVGTSSPKLLEINDPVSKIEQGLIKNCLVLPVLQEQHV